MSHELLLVNRVEYWYKLFEVGEFLQTFFQLSASIDGTTVRHGITLNANNENNAETVYQEIDNFYQQRDQCENVVRLG